MDVEKFLSEIVAKSAGKQCFYHFTDTRNLPTIRKDGLLSMRVIRDRQLEVPAPGGNDWSREADARCGMDEYVHLCFFSEHPMEYLAKKEGRIAESAFLRIRPEIIKIQGVLMTSGVANKADVTPVAASLMLDNLDLEVIYKRTNWKDAQIQERLRLAKRYEILVPNSIPVNMILNLPNG